MSGARIRLLHVCGALGLPARSVRFQQLDDDACPWEAVCAAWPRARTLASPWATAATRRPGRTWRYPGLKEHIALAGFVADPGYLGRAGIDASRPVIVVRPPADMALYHRFANPLFPLLLERLASAPVTTILLARTGPRPPIWRPPASALSCGAAKHSTGASSWPAPTPSSAPAAA